MYYDQELIDRIKDRNDIVDVIGSYISLKKKGANYVGICPFHNDTDPSLTVSRSKQIYKCFACGEAGNVFTFLMKYDNLEFPEAVKVLADRAGIELPVNDFRSSGSEKAKKVEALKELYKDVAVVYYNNLFDPEDSTGLDYFRKRGLDDATITKFGLGYSRKNGSGLYEYLKSKGYSDEILNESMLFNYTEKYGFRDKFWNRVMFPILDRNSKVVAFGGRVMGEGEPKYLNSNETLIFDKSSNLYAYYIARRTRKDYFLLCEGYMDVIALHQAGFDNAVASLGTALTEGHAGMLKRYVKDVYLSYDSDGAGQKAALRAIPILKTAGISCKVINMSPYKDPDEFIKALGADEYEKRIQNAENSFIYQIRMLEGTYDLTDPEKRSDFQKEVARRIVVEFSTQLERENYTEAVAARFNIPKDALSKYIIELGQSGLSSQNNEQKDERAAAKKKTNDDGMKMSQRLLLTWLVEQPDVFSKIKSHVSADDFEEGVYKKVAVEVFNSLNEGKTVDTARIVDMFMEDEDRKTVAALFDTTVGELTTNTDLSKALKETLVRIKKNSLENAEKTGVSLSVLLEEKRKLQRLERTEISI